MRGSETLGLYAVGYGVDEAGGIGWTAGRGCWDDTARVRGNAGVTRVARVGEVFGKGWCEGQEEAGGGDMWCEDGGWVRADVVSRQGHGMRCG